MQTSYHTDSLLGAKPFPSPPLTGPSNCSVHLYPVSLLFSPPFSKVGKTGDDEPGFAFGELARADNYKKWAREMRYALESAGIWDKTLPAKNNPKPVPIQLKDKDHESDAKLERQEKRQDKIMTWKNNNSKCKEYISRMCLSHIQQEFQTVKDDWMAHDLWEWLTKRYTLQDTASQWATIISNGRTFLCKLQKYGGVPLRVVCPQGKYC